MGKKSRQHFVPRTYLKNFAQEIDRKFFVHTKTPKVIDNGGTGFRNISHICTEWDLYDLPGQLSDDERKVVDTFYKDAYEEHWTSVYTKLVDEDVSTITQEDRRVIIGMVSSMFFRNRLWNVFHDRVMGDSIERGYMLTKEAGGERFVLFGEDVVITGRTVDEIKKEFQEKDKA